MQANPVFPARDLGGVGPPPDDRRYDDRIPGRTGSRGDEDAIAEPDAGVGGQALVYCNSSRVLRARTCNSSRVLRARTCNSSRVLRERTFNGARGLRLKRRRDQRQKDQRRAEAPQYAVSFSDSRVSASVYDGVA